ncbi:sigma-70 family RNA polymerase sigma factor [Sphingomonas sp. G-3-2-10]|uniref:sigma-70 family RNA polymerase sigma factor n=1 Tax=Sphingomonas sp. G-3-2-10 TaxID=2728838 RepID=UPI00146EC6F5|nr:sigma-70 family RNA polymerase sigma factor [Sphingomonas sp. G-3-2-10]NML04592.1 sigma-70 family RNA polymerase sigma factor [Sphingomonas sp. G-3-2-10]
MADAAESFDPLRPKLIRVAYRMLGSVADAEDVVQDAFLRWMDADRDAVEVPEAFLRRVVTRLCLDQLKSARARRETYVGPWLPEPVVEPEDAVEDVTLPLLIALERLSPLERAAFLLHDVFGLGFDEIAETIQRDSAACRQLASRARAHVRADRPRFDMPRAHGMEIAAAFFAASREGNMSSLRGLLASDVEIYSDGGGRRHAGLKPIFGVDDAIKLHTSLARFFTGGQSRLLRYGRINGLPGFITMEADGVIQTTALQIEEGRVTRIYIVRNPDKLAHLEGAALH